MAKTDPHRIRRLACDPDAPHLISPLIRECARKPNHAIDGSVEISCASWRLAAYWAARFWGRPPRSGIVFADFCTFQTRLHLISPIRRECVRKPNPATAGVAGYPYGNTAQLAIYPGRLILAPFAPLAHRGRRLSHLPEARPPNPAAAPKMRPGDEPCDRRDFSMSLEILRD